MTNMRNNALRLAIAAAFAGGVGSAGAVVNLNATTPAPLVFASEITTGGTDLVNASHALDIRSSTTAFHVGAGQPLMISVALSGGATFATAPSAACSYASGGAQVANASPYLGGAGTANVMFALSAFAASAAAGTQITGCSAVAAKYHVTGAHQNVGVTVTYKYGNPAQASSRAAGTLITWAQGVFATATPAAAVTSLAVSGFKSFNGGALTAAFGTVTYKGTAAGVLESAGTVQPSAVDYLTTASITFAGAPLAAAVSGFVVAAGGTCVSTVLTAALMTASTITLNAVTPAQLSGGVTFCAVFNGTSAIPSGTITASLVGYANAATITLNTALPAAANTVGTVAHNGSSTRALNIPAATNADAGFVRVTNNSAVAGKVYGTLYNEAGTVLGTANSVLADAATFVPNAVVVLGASDLKTKLGITTDWTGRAQLVINADTPSVRAQNLVRSASGVLTNLSGDTSSSAN